MVDAWTLGRDRLVESYVRMLKKVFDEADNKAVSAWFEQHKG